jgi:hypothetical protein
MLADYKCADWLAKPFFTEAFGPAIDRAGREVGAHR